MTVADLISLLKLTDSRAEVNGYLCNYPAEGEGIALPVAHISESGAQKKVFLYVELPANKSKE